MKRKGLRNYLIWFVLVLAGNFKVSGAIFYCDPVKGSPEGDGSERRPWRTIEEVVNSRLIQLADKNGSIKNPTAPVKSGDTIYLRSGWHGVIRIFGGYNAEYVTIAAEPGHKPQVGWVEIGQGKKWRVRSLTVSPSLAPKPFEKLPHSLVTLGERGDDSNEELSVEDCFIYTELDCSKWTAKDWIEKAKNGIWLGRYGKRHLARNNYVLNTRFGIELCAPEVICEGNVVANFSADGIRITRDGQIVQYNVIKNVFVSGRDGDANHDDGIQAFLFNVGRGTIRDVIVRGNIVVARENDRLPYANNMQGLGFFDGPLVNFKVEENVVIVNHWHGITLGDAQNSLVRSNVCYSRWGGRELPWIMLGQKINQARGNTAMDNFAHSFSFKDDLEVKAQNNQEVTEEIAKKRLSQLLEEIEKRYGKIHPVAGLGRLNLEW